MGQELIKSKALKDIIQRDEVKTRLREIMGTRAPQFAAALVQIVGQSWQLQKCDPNSIIGAALTAAALDLSIDPNLGEAHIVPYGEKAQFQIGYIGFNQLAMRSGQYKNLGWKVVHKGELEHYDELSGELEVNSNHPDEEVVGYAAKFKLLNGFERGLYWTKEKCFAHAERYSKAYKAGIRDASKRDSVWWTDPDRACLKTVIKMLVKLWGPKSIQMQKALKVDEGAIIDADTGEVSYVDSPGNSEVTTPEFTSDKLPVREDKEVVVEPVKPQEKKAKAKEEPKAEPPLVAKIKEAGLTQKDIIGFLLEIGSIDEEYQTIEMLEDKAPEVYEMLSEQFADIVERIKSVK
jgi:recombination protein RecT